MINSPSPNTSFVGITVEHLYLIAMIYLLVLVVNAPLLNGSIAELFYVLPSGKITSGAL
jgi:hypothetical protein